MAARVLAAAATVAVAIAQIPPGGLGPGEWVLTWADEFDGTALNASNWNVAVNRTQDAGHSVFIPDAISVSGGSLVITTTHQPYPVANQTRNFTGGWIDSRNKFSQREGRFEWRAKMPRRDATCSWPAGWLLPNAEAACWPIGTELDVFEFVAGAFPQRGNASNPSAMGLGEHYGFQCYSDVSGAWTLSHFPNYTDPRAPLVDFSADFHVFGLVHNAANNSATFYIDGAPVYTIAPPPQSDPSFTWGKTPYLPFADMYAIINYSVAPWGCPQPPPLDGWTGAAGATAQLEVDYFRAYAWQPTA